MNPFQRARNEATKVRALLACERAAEGLSAFDLLSRVEDILNLAVEKVDPGYTDLGGGSAVLKREQQFIYVSNTVSADKHAGLVAHEIGHWFLDPTKAAITVAHLQTLFGSDGSPAVLTVEAYGARERQELQANVFARELLLPRLVARKLAALGNGPSEVATDLGIPLEFARQQMLDALMLPEAAEAADKVLHPPSPDQRAAAEAKERFANVVAGPGTGKTSTLIHRVKYLVEQLKVDPSHILVLTFTNKAAFELVERLRSAGIERAADVWAGTFHAFGLEFLRKYHQHFSLGPDLQVADKLNAMTLLSSALPNLELKYYLRVQDPYDWLNPVIAAIKRLKEELVSPALYRERIGQLDAETDELRCRREDIATLYEAYEELLVKKKTVDFVDLVAKPAIAIREDRPLYSEMADKFQYILVDEYQDVTLAMVELIRQLAQKAKSLWVVGDVRQAIHHWRGASVKSLTKFDTEFKAQAGTSKIRKYPLDNNRRSTQEILDLVEQAGKLHVLQPTLALDVTVANNGLCGEKPGVITCTKRSGMLEAIRQEIENRRNDGVSYGDQAVLSRNGADVRRTAEMLAGKGVPVLYIGELAQRPEVKGLLCLMQLLVERQPRALVGLLAIPQLGMPLDDIHVLLEAADQDIRWQRGKWIDDVPPGLTVPGLEVIGRIRDLLAGYTHRSNPWNFVCDLLLERRFNLPHSADISMESWIKRIALWQFAYSVRNGDGEAKEARLSRFLLRQRLRQRIGETYIDRELPPEAAALDAVRVQTVHGSKGLEYEAVHVAYVEAGSYGSKKPTWEPPDSILDIVPPEVMGSTIAEYDFETAIERNNLLYVALSRAKRHLWLYQDVEFGDKNIAPQLLHYPRQYDQWTFETEGENITNNGADSAFEASDGPVPFDRFQIYARCPLQYWYRYVLGLRSEQDAESALRARWAIMRALKAVAQKEAGTPKNHFIAAWTDNRLPEKDIDPSLWRDAVMVYKRGLELVKKFLAQGATFVEAQTTVAGLDVELPWGFADKGKHLTVFHLIRFSRHGVSDVQTLLRPMLSGMPQPGTKEMTLHNLLSYEEDEVMPSKAVMKTKAAGAAIRFLDGDGRPDKGRHCGRCAYMTICPSRPEAAF